MKIKGHLIEFDFDFKQQKHYITFAIDDGNIKEVNNLKDKPLTIKIEEVERAKSPSQNNFFWAIVQKIADHKNILSTKEEVYRALLLNYGENIGTLRTDKKTEPENVDFHYVLAKRGRKYNYYNILKGISLMTRKEMTIFIEHTLIEAQELGIDTTPPYEWERLKKIWLRNQ